MLRYVTQFCRVKPLYQSLHWLSGWRAICSWCGDIFAEVLFSCIVMMQISFTACRAIWLWSERLQERLELPYCDLLHAEKEYVSIHTSTALTLKSSALLQIISAKPVHNTDGLKNSRGGHSVLLCTEPLGNTQLKWIWNNFLESKILSLILLQWTYSVLCQHLDLEIRWFVLKAGRNNFTALADVFTWLWT